MYSTLDGAKKCAKSLKRLFDESGFRYSLQKCQAATAQAGGHRDWHDLESALRGGPRPLDRAAFRKRLIAALPEPCLPPVAAWLDREPHEAIVDARAPARWYRDVFPFVMAVAALHRRQTALLRPGSGPGQKLRESLVVGLVLNVHGGDRAYPRLEPDTLALVFRGDLEAVFRSDAAHPRFAAELQALVDAGVLDVRPGEVRVLPSDTEAVLVHVRDGRSGKAQHWAEAGGAEAVYAMRDALAAIGVRDALRLAGAIADLGSDAYIVPSGPVLELMSELADEGELETFSRAYGLLATIRPASARSVREAVPAKITSRYLARHRGLGASRIMSWALANPDWPDRLKEAVSEPARFARTVESMVASISAP